MRLFAWLIVSGCCCCAFAFVAGFIAGLRTERQRCVRFLIDQDQQRCRRFNQTLAEIWRN